MSLPSAGLPETPSARILLVEDDQGLAWGLKNNLEFEGYEVDVVGNGIEAVARIAERGHDLVVLDLMLPGMDGFRVLAGTRAAGIPIPVLVLSAKDRAEDVIRALREGVDDYVTKPFELANLLERIAVLLGRRETRPEAGHLTIREAEIYHLIARGLSNKRIASRLGISVGTVKAHVHTILGKLGLTSRSQIRG